MWLVDKGPSHDPQVRMHLLKKKDLTLGQAIKICQASESTKTQIKTFSKENETVEVNAVQQTRPNETTNIKKKDARPNQESGNWERCGMKNAPKQCRREGMPKMQWKEPLLNVLFPKETGAAH